MAQRVLQRAYPNNAYPNNLLQIDEIKATHSQRLGLGRLRVTAKTCGGFFSQGHGSAELTFGKAGKLRLCGEADQLIEESTASSDQPRKLAATTCFCSLVQPDTAAMTMRTASNNREATNISYNSAVE